MTALQEYQRKYQRSYREKIRKQKEREKLKPCSYCSFEPLHVVQMDWDHIDGDHKNNDPNNLQLLCANCHRLKTELNGDRIRWRQKLKFER